MLNRTIFISAKQYDEFLEVIAVQTDRLDGNPPVKYELIITGHFDGDLVLTSIRLDKMMGSKGEICHSAKESLQALVGMQVGDGFGKKAREISGSDSCMHFTTLLGQMATTAFRCGQIKVLQRDGEGAFLDYNQMLFKGKCVGYK